MYKERYTLLQCSFQPLIIVQMLLNFRKRKMEIMDTKEYEMVSRRFSDLKESEQLYLTLHLLGSRMQSIPVDFMEEESGQESQWLSRNTL